jgi:Spy/CpxP family protein refolding chaperone
MPMTPIAVSLASSFVMIACLPISADAKPRHEEVLTAQNNDSDTPPELRQHLRAHARANDDSGAGTGSGGPAFGERPFRRPRGTQDGDGNNAQPPRTPDETAGGAAPQGLHGGGPGPGMPPDSGPPGGNFAGFKRGGNRGNRFGGPAPDGVARFRRGLGAEGPPGDAPMPGRFRKGGTQGPGGGIFGRKPLDFSSLNLTDDQKQRIQQIRSSNGVHARGFSQSLKERRSEMRDLMFDPVASDDQIRSKMREVRQMQEKMDDVQINDFLAIRKVLTPEQRQKLADLKPERKVADQPQADGGPSQQQR